MIQFSFPRKFLQVPFIQESHAGWFGFFFFFQLQKLNEMMQQPGEANLDSGAVETRDNAHFESDVKPSSTPERSEHGGGDYFVMEKEPTLLTMVEPVDGSLTSPEDWQSWDSETVFDQSSENYQWWDFWV